MSPSELQMLASMKRQQNEELEDSGPSHGLSASQIDNCNISISTSSDDTTTWNSCLPAVSLNAPSISYYRVKNHFCYCSGFQTGVFYQFKG